MSIELKIKSKHLAEEARIIRFEEHKLAKQYKYLSERQRDAYSVRYKREDIALHRRWNVRNEQRATYLARAFIAKKPYEEVERNTKDKCTLHYRIVPRVQAMVYKYGDSTVTNKDINNWILGK